MLRALAVVLLLANALVLAWSLGTLDGLLGRRPDADREPERLQRQVNPELVKLRPAAAASRPVAVASTAAASTLCLESAPLPAGALAAAEKMLLSAGVAPGSWTTSAAGSKGVFLIYMGRYEDDETLQRKLEELKRRRIEAQPVRQPDLQPGIEVGRFDDKDDAEATLARLSQRGLRTARVLTLVPPQPQLVLRLAAAEASQADALGTLQLTPTVSGFSRCGTAPAAAAIPVATSSTAAAAAVPAALGSAARPAASRPRSAGAGSGAAAGSSAASPGSAAPASPAARGAAPGSAASAP